MTPPRPLADLLLGLLIGADLDATDRRALALYVLTLARRVRELQACTDTKADCGCT